MDARADLALSAGITLVILYEGGEFYLRVLDRAAKPKPTYLTRHIPVSVAVLRAFAKRAVTLHTWESDGIGVRTMTNVLLVYRVGSEFAMAMGSLTFLAQRTTELLRKVGLEFEEIEP